MNTEKQPTFNYPPEQQLEKSKLVKKKPRVPYCYSCYDKGWNSYLANQTISADFPGDRTISGIVEGKRYCGCKKGQKLKKLETNGK